MFSVRKQTQYEIIISDLDLKAYYIDLLNV